MLLGSYKCSRDPEYYFEIESMWKNFSW